MIIIFHANCADGFCSAWLLKKRFPDATFVAANYGDAPPDVKDQDVIIADFSYKRPVMASLIKDCKSLVVLDHHKTAEAELSGLQEAFLGVPDIKIIFNMNRSGAGLVSEYYGLTSWLVDYTEDRDLWRWELPNSRAVNAAISSYTFDFGVWDALNKEPIEDFVQEGLAILRYQERCIEGQIKHAQYTNFNTKDGIKIVPCMNATHLLSEITGRLAEGHLFAATWFRREDGKYQFSLRSEEYDVSEVALRYGGGGHKRASGFTVDELWF